MSKQKIKILLAVNLYLSILPSLSINAMKKEKNCNTTTEINNINNNTSDELPSDNENLASYDSEFSTMLNKLENNCSTQNEYIVLKNKFENLENKYMNYINNHDKKNITLASNEYLYDQYISQIRDKISKIKNIITKEIKTKSNDKKPNNIINISYKKENNENINIKDNDIKIIVENSRNVIQIL